MQLNSDILCLRLEKMKLEQERAELYNKVKILENQEGKENNRIKWTTNKEKEQLSKKKMHKASRKEKNNTNRDWV